MTNILLTHLYVEFLKIEGIKADFKPLWLPGEGGLGEISKVYESSVIGLTKSGALMHNS
jgi:hypothetical protein